MLYILIESRFTLTILLSAIGCRKIQLFKEGRKLSGLFYTVQV